MHNRCAQSLLVWICACISTTAPAFWALKKSTIRKHPIVAPLLHHRCTLHSASVTVTPALFGTFAFTAWSNRQDIVEMIVETLPGPHLVQFLRHSNNLDKCNPEKRWETSTRAERNGQAISDWCWQKYVAMSIMGCYGVRLYFHVFSPTPRHCHKMNLVRDRLYPLLVVPRTVCTS